MRARSHFHPSIALLACAAILASPVAAPAVELKKDTLAAFQRYAHAREAQLDQGLKDDSPFLWVDTLSKGRRRDAYAQMKHGEVFIERLKMLVDGKEIDCPDGLIHHWIGTVFIPGTTLERTLALLQDYDHHATNFAPEVIASKTLERDGDHFKIYMRFVKKKVVTVVEDTWQDVQYVHLDSTRAYSRALTTRVQEVENAGKRDERLKPPGKDGGFLWNLYTYWRFEERDGGVYIQCEAISLTRDVPFLLAWLRRFITSVPKESLVFTLGTARNLLSRPAPAESR